MYIKNKKRLQTQSFYIVDLLYKTIQILQAHSKNTVELTMELELDKVGYSSNSAEMTVSLNGHQVDQRGFSFRGKKKDSINDNQKS